jgi:hypothetical protein
MAANPTVSIKESKIKCPVCAGTEGVEILRPPRTRVQRDGPGRRQMTLPGFSSYTVSITLPFSCTHCNVQWTLSFHEDDLTPHVFTRTALSATPIAPLQLDKWQGELVADSVAEELSS